MAGSKEIKSKIKTVGNIKKITRAMEMIARTKMKRAVDGVLSVRPYALYARELLAHLASDQLLESPFLKEGSGNKALVIAIAADKGLCGGYNANVGRLLKKRTEKGDEIEVIAIGKKAANEARKLGLNIVETYTNVPNKLSAEFTKPIAELAKEAFFKGSYKTVEVIFTDYVSSLTQKTNTKQVLPVSLETVEQILDESSTEATEGQRLDHEYEGYIFEPSEQIILQTIVPRLVDVGILHALFESRASEESMRMFAMKNATENAEELQNDLTLSYNRARQRGITQEIAEIAAGAEALK